MTSYSQNLNEYTLKEQIGKGTFGDVYKAIHNADNQTVALKIMNLDKLKQAPNGISRVETEISVQSQLNHEGIIKLYTSFIDKKENKYILVLQYHEGETLFDFLKKQKDGKFEESRCYFIFYQIVQIIKYLHQNEFIHRDLKLQNILIYPDTLRVKLIDFGLAASTSMSPDRYTWCGTPNYCAPEIVQQQKHGYLADVWSLGCMLYSLLTGAPPFHTGDTKKTLSKIVNHTKILYPSHLSQSAKHLLQKLLNKSTNDRINTSDILNTHWMLRKGKELQILNISHLKSRKRQIKKINASIELTENESVKIVMNKQRFSLQIFAKNAQICVINDHVTNIKKEYEISTLPIEFYKVYDILSEFINIIASQSPIIVLFVRKKNKQKLKRIVLLQNRDIDFRFDTFCIHYSQKKETFECNSEHNNAQNIQTCKTLIARIYEIFDDEKSNGDYDKKMYPIEMKIDLKSQIAIHHFEATKWRYYLLCNMQCIRIKEGKKKQIFEFAENKKIKIIVEGKQTPYLMEMDEKENKIEITSENAQKYEKYWQCVTSVLCL